MDDLLRAFVLLMVCASYIEDTGLYPTQLLLCRKIDNRYDGLLNIFWKKIGLDRYNPFAFSGAPHITSAALLLEKKKLMLPRGSWSHKEKYILTDCGWDFYRKFAPKITASISPKDIEKWMLEIDCSSHI